MKHKFKLKRYANFHWIIREVLNYELTAIAVWLIKFSTTKKKLKFCLLFLSTGYKCWKIFDILCRYLSSRYCIYVLIIWQKSLCMIYLFFMINLDIPKPVFNNSIIFKKNIPAVSGAIAYSTSVSYCSISILSQPQ